MKKPTDTLRTQNRHELIQVQSILLELGEQRAELKRRMREHEDRRKQLQGILAAFDAVDALPEPAPAPPPEPPPPPADVASTPIPELDGEEPAPAPE